MGHHSLPGSSIEHRLDILPGVDNLVVRVSHQPDVAPPRVEVGSVRLDIFSSLGQTVRVKHKLKYFLVYIEANDISSNKLKLKGHPISEGTSLSSFGKLEE